MKVNGFSGVTIDGEVADRPIAERIRAYADRHGIEVATEVGRDDVNAGHTLTSGKRAVHVTRFQGAAVKPCTGLEEHYVCCNLHVMNQTTNCPLECSYCILQAYINSPVTTMHANVDEMLDQVRQQAATQPGRLFRIGTGDLGDALALDPISGATAELVPAFARIDNAILELKTKSDCVDPLLTLEHGGRTVVAWSVNTPSIIAAEEHLCATLEQRLVAARKVVAAGYPVAFHFDPMIVHDGWELGYPETVQRIFDAVPAESVAWISMGSLRFPPSMAATMRERFPKSTLTLGELVLGQDGKTRYLKPQRMQLYSRLLSAIRQCGGPEPFAYLCMEPPEVWRRVMGRSYASNQALDFAFSSSLVSRFEYLMPQPPRFSDYDGATNLGSSRPGSTRVQGR